jgi:tetratricopeptide (TPR) repeat protein
MFFGYVENYPLFIVAVVLYLYVGVLVLKRGVSRWWILVSNLIAAFFHILGLTLLPATVYLLIRDSRLGKWLGERSALVKLSLAVLTAASLAACFFYLFFTSYPFRFAFLPVVRDRFTASGYTMFSGKHLLDIANQLILLSPGLLVLAVFGVSTRERLAATSQLFRFAVLVLACSLTSVLIFDPKLGMARDWDLFGFVGVALNFLLLVFVLGRKKSNRPALIAALLAVALSGTFLVARVAAKRTDDIAIKRLESFTPLDPVRNNKNGLLISTYYLDHGDSLKGLQIDSAWQRSNRDIFMCAYGKALFDSGKVVQALSAYRQAIAINPFEAIGYNNLGHAFTNVGQLDSGRYYLQIAQGLRPKNGMIKCNLGWIAFQQGDDEEAEKLWLESIKLDSASITPQMFLLRLYKKDNRIAKYLERLPRVAEYKDAPMMILVEASLDYYQRRQIQDARRLWNRAVALGLDSAKCEQVLRQYPELRENKQNK